MAFASEPTPTSGFGLGNLWGLWGETDRTKWRWEAPTRQRTKAEDAVPTFLPWLSGTALRKDASVSLDDLTLSNDYAKARLKELAFGLDEVTTFQRAVECSPNNIPIICAEFSKRLKQSLTLGFVEENTLRSVLNVIPRAILQANSDTADVQFQCFELYQSIWDGLEACKVLSPDRLHGKTLNTLLERVLQLQATMAMRSLSVRIVQGASIIQLGYMRQTLDKLIIGWELGCLDLTLDFEVETHMQVAMDAMQDSKLAIDHVQRLLALLRTQPLCDHLFTQIHNAIRNANSSLYDASEKYMMLEKLRSPWKDHLAPLAGLLESLPSALVRTVIRSCTDHLVRGSFGIKALGEGRQEDLRQMLLSLAAYLPAVEDHLFQNLLKNMACSSSFKPSFISELMLEHWMSQGYLNETESIRHMVNITGASTTTKDPATLLYAIEQHKQPSWVLTQKLFEVLDDLGEYKMLGKTVHRMHKLGMKLPAHLMAPIIRDMSKRNCQMAYALYNLYYAMRVDHTPIKLEQIPDFVVAMINGPMAPASIWKLLGIPVYYKRLKLSMPSKTLSPLKIKLLTQMATAFAYSDRPPRIAFRNVMLCIYYLRKYHIPLSPELSRAITHSGITTKILNGKWVPEARMGWALGLIERAEGKEVAVMASMAVSLWNDAIVRKQVNHRGRVRRERNVLRVGPID